MPLSHERNNTKLFYLLADSMESELNKVNETRDSDREVCNCTLSSIRVLPDLLNHLKSRSREQRQLLSLCYMVTKQ